jgi:diaminopimelate decarboxylase
MEIVPGTRLRALLDRYGSPLYVYSESILRENIARLRRAFPDAHLYHFTPSNRCPGILRFMRDRMDGMTATAPLGAQRALRFLPATRVIVSGSNYSQADLAWLTAVPGLRVNFNSLAELRAVAARRPGHAVGVRLDTGVKSRVYTKESEMDVPLVQVPELAAIDVRVAMIHCYAGTAQTTGNLVNSARTLCETVLRHPRVFAGLETINIAGGIAFDDLTGEFPDVEGYGREVSGAIADLCARLGRRVRLILEPGRVNMANSASLYCHINQLYDKDGRPFIGIDATRFQFGDLSKFGKLDEDAAFALALYDAHGHTVPHSCTPQPGQVYLGIHGNTHYSKDRLRGVFVRAADVARLANGFFELKYAGAYASSMTSTWADREMPAEVMLRPNQSLQLLEQRQRPHEVVLSRLERAHRHLRRRLVQATAAGAALAALLALGAVDILPSRPANEAHAEAVPAAPDMSMQRVRHVNLFTP